MDNETRRYRVRTKNYLCLSPEEAIATGITTGEQVVEELFLVKHAGWGCSEYAALRTEPPESLRKMPVLERREAVFSSRGEAANFLRQQPRGTYELYGVRETRTVPREEIAGPEDQPAGNVMEELKAFEKGGLKE